MQGWPLGLLLSLFASIFGIIGKIALKLSHVRKCNKTFLLGILCIVVLNPGFSAIAYRFAAQSLLAPMAGLSVVWNTILSPYLLQESIAMRDLFGASFIFAGCILVGLTGAHTTIDIPLDQLLSHFISEEFLLYLLCFLLLVGMLLKFAWPAIQTVYYGFPVQHVDCQRTRICFVALAGLISGQMYFLTAVMRILDDGTDIFNNGLTYMSIIGALLFGLFGLYLLNLSLRLYDAIFVIYIYESCYIISGAVSGICFFNEMSNFSTWHCILYVISMVQIIVGIHVISQRDDEIMNEKSAQLIDLDPEEYQHFISTEDN